MGSVENSANPEYNDNSEFPLSSGQKGLWFLHQINPLSARYNVPVTFKVGNDIEFADLKQLLNIFINRHTLMHSGFHLHSGQPIRKAEAQAKINLDRVDVSLFSYKELCKSIKEQTEIAFDLQQAPLLRATVLEGYKSSRILLLVFHHLVFDGASLRLLIDELNLIHQAITAETTKLPALEFDFHDYTDWQQQWLMSEDSQQSQQFWQQQLAGEIPRLQLPLKKKGKAQETISGEVKKFAVSTHVREKFKQLATEHKCSEFLLWLMAYFAFLSRYTLQKDIIIGNPYMGRPDSRFDKIIGFFANIAPIRCQFKDPESFLQLLNRNKDNVYNSLFHGDYPIEELISQLQLPNQKADELLFQTAFVWTQAADINKIDHNSLGLEVLPLVHQTAEQSLTLELLVIDDKIEGLFKYRSNVFSHNAIDMLSESFSGFIENLANNPETLISDHPILTPAQTNLQLDKFNYSTELLEEQKCIHQQFEAQVIKYPHNTAIIENSEQISYAELNSRSNKLAHYLLQQGVVLEDIIAVCSDRSIDMIVAFMAILKAGAAYLPLDPNYPQQRLKHIVDDSRVKYVISSLKMAEKFDNMHLLCMDAAEFQTKLSTLPSSNPQIDGLDANNLAYIIYTSGSSGQPKGVMVEHKSVSNLCQWHIDYYAVNSQKCASHMAGVGFDAVVVEVWPYLLRGARIVIIADELRLSLPELFATINSQKVNYCFLPTALVPNAIKILNSQRETSLQYLLTGGEQLSACSVHNGKTILVNNYGPTESTVIASSYQMSDKDIRQTPALGQAIDNYQLLVLDKDMQLLPIGCIGELYIGGAGLARGYLHQEKLSKERFIEYTINDKAIRLYKTGDLVHYREDGNLVFDGRVDNQVKIRGYRIELGEIEGQISLNKAVQNCIVIANTEASGQKRLLAYVCHDSNLSNDVLIAEINDHLQSVLADYMLPAHILILDSLPLTANGKIDKQALPIPSGKATVSAEQHCVPSSDIECKLAEIWAEILKIPLDEVSSKANFFALGGDSILSIQMVSMALEMDLKLTIKQIFEHKTIQSLAPHVVKNKIRISQDAVTGEMQLLPIQHNFFRDETELHHYNQAVLLQTPDDFNIEQLSSFIAVLYQRHDALRLRFSSNKCSQWQAHHQPLNKQMLKDTVAEIKLKEKGFDTLAEQAQHYQSSLNITTGSLFKAVLCSDKAGEKRLLLIIHHLVVDAVSWRIIIDDLENLYQQHKNDEPLKLANKSSSYQVWSQQLLSYSRSDKLLAETDYWKNVLAAPLAELGTVKEGNKKASFTQASFSLNEITTSRLLTQAQQAYRTQINELLLSALLLGFHNCTGSNSIRIDLEGHGRQELNEDINLSQTVGWFTTLFPITLNSDSMDFETLICAVKEQLRAVPNQGIGFAVLKYLSKTKGIESAEISPILFNYLGQFSKQEDYQRAFKFAEADIGHSVSPLRQPEHNLNFNGSVTQNRLSFTVDYNENVYDSSLIEQLLEHIKQATVAVIEHCMDPLAGCFTPADFPMLEVDQKQLRQWQNQYLIEDIYPATVMQQGLLYHSALDNSAYITQLMFTLKAGVDMALFHQAWQMLVDRHTILRTVFISTDAGEMQQLVQKKMVLPWTEKNIEPLPDNAQQQLIDAERKADKGKGFDLQKGPLLRLQAWALGKGRYRLLFSNHHALTDGWSMPLIFKDVQTLYQILKTASNKKLATAIPYKNYIQWLQGWDKTKATAYWQQQLENTEGATKLFEEQEVEQQQHLLQDLLINAEQTNQLTEIAKKSQVTLNSLLQAAWAYLLSRYSNRSQVVFGTTVSGRPADLANVEQMIGLFINTIPVIIDVPTEVAFSQWLSTIQQQSSERLEHSYLPLIEIQQLVAEKALIDSLFIFENYPFDEKDINADNRNQFNVSDYKAYEETDYSLTLTAVLSRQLSLNFSAKNSCFSAKTLRKLLNHFENILQSIIENAEQDVQEIALLSPQEEQSLLHSMDGQQADYPQQQCIQHLFEQQVACSADDLALVYADEHYSFSELNIKANQLAHLLLDQGVKVNTVVGFCLPRGVEMVVTILAILKTGAGYLPLDPSHPPQRLAYMIEDAGLNTIVTTAELLGTVLPNTVNAMVLDNATVKIELASSPQSNPVIDNVQSSHLAYIIYTSGSTGKPKGVMIQHHALVNFLYAMQAQLGGALNPATRWLAVTTIAFDIAGLELFGPLLFGGQLVLASKEDSIDPVRISGLLQKHDISCMQATPATWQMLVDSQWQGNNELTILSGGEALPISLARSLHKRCAELWNCYGPTEATVWSLIKAISADDLTQKAISIGGSLPNYYHLVLDHNHALMPKGTIGELYIGGHSLASGYQNRKELSTEKFIRNPHSENHQDYLYATGDLVRYRHDGTLDFIGRIDDQVKVRGYRIELGEIEQQLLGHDKVINCAVKAIRTAENNVNLVAYITQDSEMSNEQISDELSRFLQQKLPSYMLPSQYIILQSIPLTANGKIDRKSLPLPTSISQDNDCYSAPVNDTETELCRVWSELFNIPADTIGTQSNFFKLGGNSLIVVKLLTKIRVVFELNLSIQTIFEIPLLADLATHIQALNNNYFDSNDEEDVETESFEI
jgi:amino acid adenylation domain-containing protein/non-ribosomal peptide synthase protein (TIGR01720 family)